VTEAEWHGGDDPGAMLEFLRDKAGDRKKRLFMAACCRGVWRLLPDPRSRRAVEVAEWYADGAATRRELAAAHGKAVAVAGHGVRHVAWAAYWTSSRTLSDSIINNVRFNTAQAAAREAHDAGAAANPVAAYAAGGAAEARRQADILRDLFGNPFRPSAVDPAWLTWKDGTVRKLARAIYDERHFADLPILADALEEAGCADAEILGHCRGGGDHFRGCWVLDLLLARE
jgi:hypothetical protein